VGNWDVFLRLFYQVPYGLGVRQGSICSLPAYVVLKNWLLLTLIASVLFAGAVYWLHGDLDFSQQSRSISQTTVAHGSVLLGVFFAVKAWSYVLDRFLLLYGDNGVVVGASFTDVHLALPVLWLLIGLAVVAAFLCWANLRVRTYKLPLAATVLVFGTSFLLAEVLPAVFQRVYVRPNELQLEKSYIQSNIALTQEAYDERLFSLRPAASQSGHQLYPQFGQDRHRRLQRHGRLLSCRCLGPDGCDLPARLPGPNFVGCSNGRSAGLAPFKILST
jgi:uncharacterized protein